MNDSRPTSDDIDGGEDPGDRADDAGVDASTDGASSDGPADGASSDDAVDEQAGDDDQTTDDGGEKAGDDGEPSEAELRRRVEEKYDFDQFGPADMAEMSADEWDAAFDPDTWITGEELLDRVEMDLERRVASRDVFAVIERRPVDGRDAVLAYSDEGYALVHGDGSIEGFGTALRDVKPTVALCSMESYEVEPAPAGAVLPRPEEVPEGSGELGNLMLQVVAAVLGLSGVVLLASAVFAPGVGGSETVGRGLMIVFGLLFVAATIVLFFTVANARLADKFRAEEYRDRLRAVGLEDGERPEFLPIEDGDERVDSTLEGATADGDRSSDDERSNGDESDPGNARE